MALRECKERNPSPHLQRYQRQMTSAEARGVPYDRTNKWPAGAVEWLLLQFEDVRGRLANLESRLLKIRRLSSVRSNLQPAELPANIC